MCDVFWLKNELKHKTGCENICNIDMLKVILLVSTIIGTYIGAGFASGKEISCFLAKYGYISVPFIVIISVCYYFLIKKAMNISKNLDKENKDYSQFFGKYSFLINFFICASAIITIAGTLSGSRSVGKILFEGNNYYIQIIIILLAFYICAGGISNIGVCNLFAVPMIVFYLLFIGIRTFAIGGTLSSYNEFCNNYLMSFAMFVFYLCSNFMTLGVLLLQIGKNYNKKEINLTALFSSAILGILILSYAITMLIWGQNILNAEMPLLSITFNFGKVYGVLASVVLWLALFTTLISCVFVASNYINKCVKNKYVCIIITMGMGFILSLFGFSFVVSYLYSIAGVFGIVFLFLMLVPKNEKNKLLLKKFKQ